MALELSTQDVTDAEDFLEEFLSDKITDGDYSDGSALRDLTIKGIAYTFAYLRATEGQVRARQSLKSISEVDTSDDAEAADDAVDEILSNWFATRQRGKFARVSVYGHATERMDIDIPATTRFYRTSTLAFLLDNNGEPLHIPSEALIAQFDSSGEIIDYTFRIPIVSESTGVDYNVEPGRFASFDAFSIYVTYVEVLEAAKGGDDIESSEDFVARSQNLITVRNLINARSCDAVLRDKYADIRTLTVIGMGDKEMVRDLVVEKATGLTMHVGGHQDIYIEQEVTETSFSAVVGAKFARPDGLINIFRDPTVVTGVNPSFTFPGMGVTVGMVLRVWEGLGSSGDYMIREVRDTELFVSERVPFPIATDEEVPAAYVIWSIGNVMPDYVDVIATQTTGQTSRQIQNSGRITLPGGPLYYIKSVTIDDPTDPDTDPSDNLVHLNTRVNTTPTAQVAPDNEYQVVVHNQGDHQSMRSFAELIVGPDGDEDKYDGKTCKVTYDSISGFSSIADFVVNRRQRISAANPLVKGFHPIYVAATIEYKLKRQATTSVDEEEAASAVVDFINAFPSTEVLDVSMISDFLNQSYPDIGHVYPFTINYYVHVPDGRVIAFETTEAVTVPSSPSDLEQLLLYPDDEVEGLMNPLDYGLTDDVMRYLARAGDIVVTERV